MFLCREKIEPTAEAIELQQEWSDLHSGPIWNSFGMTNHLELKEYIKSKLYRSPEHSTFSFGKIEQAKIETVFEAIIKNGVDDRNFGTVIITNIFVVSQHLENPKDLSQHAVFQLQKSRPQTRREACLQKIMGNNTTCTVEQQFSFSFVDEEGRVYTCWPHYLNTNKLPQGLIIAPKDGRYQKDDNNEVLLDVIKSPAGSLKQRTLEKVDRIGTVPKITATVMGICVAGPAVTVPLIVSGAGIVAAAAGAYVTAQGIMQLMGRHSHKQVIKATHNTGESVMISASNMANSLSICKKRKKSRKFRKTELFKLATTILLIRNGVTAINLANTCMSQSQQITLMYEFAGHINSMSKQHMYQKSLLQDQWTQGLQAKTVALTQDHLNQTDNANNLACGKSLNVQKVRFIVSTVNQLLLNNAQLIAASQFYLFPSPLQAFLLTLFTSKFGNVPPKFNHESDTDVATPNKYTIDEKFVLEMAMKWFNNKNVNEFMELLSSECKEKSLDIIAGMCEKAGETFPSIKNLSTLKSQGPCVLLYKLVLSNVQETRLWKDASPTVKAVLDDVVEQGYVVATESDRSLRGKFLGRLMGKLPTFMGKFVKHLNNSD